MGTLTREEFPLPTLAPQLKIWLEEVNTGRGFNVIRGLNVNDYSDDEVFLAFWGLAALGVAWEWQRLIGGERLGLRVTAGVLELLGPGASTSESSLRSLYAYVVVSQTSPDSEVDCSTDCWVTWPNGS